MVQKDNKVQIGVFDSGVGGLSVANYLEENLENIQIQLVQDTQNIPYGNKSPDLLLELVTPLLHRMVEDGCQVIVIACNTVTTNIINHLRKDISVPLIGMEPMVKTAAEQTKNNCIAVCATPATLNSDRYKWLKEQFASKVDILEPDCSRWSSMIEANQVEHQFIKKQMKDACQKGADVIVLGCTHYHWIEEEIQKTVAGKAKVLQPVVPVAKQLKRIIEELG